MVATVIDRVCVFVLRSWSRLRRKQSTSMEGWTRVGPSLLHAQPNLQRNDEGRREEDAENERGERWLSPVGLSLHKRSQSNTWQRRRRMKTTILRDTPKPVFHFFFLFCFSYLPLNCCHSSSSSVLLFLCICVTFLKTCSTKNEKTQRCHSVAYQSVYFYFFCLFVLWLLLSWQQNDN